jgi:hypothetical protein
MKLTLALILALPLLLLTTHRLPAPIQEIETPTPAPSAKAKSKPNPPREAKRKSETDSTDVSAKSHAAPNSAGPATVFIYRPAGFPWGMYSGTVVTMDGAQTRTMADARYSVRKLSPGKHVFEVKGGVITSQRIPIEIDLQSGQTYYLRVSIDAMGFPEGKILFTQVPGPQGAQETAKLTQGP